MRLMLFFAALLGSRLARVLSFLAIAVVGTWPPAVVAQDRDLINGQGLLWRIEPAAGQESGQGGTPAPSYLFGTIHATDSRVLELPPEVRRAFSGASSASFEILSLPSEQNKMLGAMLLTDGRTLQSIIGTELFTRASEAAAAYGMPPQLLQRFKPWALFAVFAFPPEEAARNQSGNKHLDGWLETMARDRGLPVYELESVEEQLALFDGMSEADQVVLLRAAVDGAAEIDTQFERMIRYYLARDLTGLHAMMVAQMAETGSEITEVFRERLIDRRNLLMAERMEERLREGGAFVAVGALHLPGETGIVKLLRDKGYRVTRVY